MFVNGCSSTGLQPNKNNPSIDATTSKKRSRNALDNYHNNTCQYTCCWWLCSTSVNSSEQLMDHMLSHVNPYQNSGAVSCLWKGCDMPNNKVMNYEEAVRHISYHVYHLHLKQIGDFYLREKNRSKCTQPTNKMNSIPYAHDQPFCCRWSNCGFSTDIAMDFYRHVVVHVEAFSAGNFGVRHCICLWTGCTVRVNSRSHLKEHLRVHTLDKVAACSVCGKFFSNREKLLLHVDRQQKATGSEKHMCSFCHKSFPTKSLLLQHVYHHVNHYVCTYCGFTVRAPSDLKRHIFNKHQFEKPFICTEKDCVACFKTEFDLKRHISEVHKKETKFDCFVENCSFSCIHFAKLVTHLKNDHKNFNHLQPQYACHLCDNIFNSSTPLSRHLKTSHDISYPQGTGRFRYVLESDGFYRLQVERVNQLKDVYESADIVSSGENNDGVSNDNASNNADNNVHVVFIDESCIPVNQLIPLVCNQQTIVFDDSNKNQANVVFMPNAFLSNTGCGSQFNADVDHNAGVIVADSTESALPFNAL